jgi:hypothetical protein
LGFGTNPKSPIPNPQSPIPILFNFNQIIYFKIKIISKFSENFID